MAAISPVAWLWARTASMMAVRDPEALSAKPLVRPDAMFAAPSARNSRFGSMTSPVRTANARPVSATSV